MKTKSYKLIESRTMKGYTFLLMMLAVFSCDDFAEVEPEDRIDATTFFANDLEVVIGVNGAYAAQRGIFGDMQSFNLLETRSDNTVQNTNEQAERFETDTFEEGIGNLPNLVVWGRMYNVINLANLVITRGPDAQGDANLISRAVGEAKFLRAFSYFHMVVMWGGVPLRLEPIKDFGDESQTIVPRSTATQVYDQIVSDLNDATATLPDSYAGGLNKEKGRATRLAALTLLGKVQLQRGNISEAVTALRQVEGRYSLLADYSNIHSSGNNNSAESIFEINFLPGNQTAYGLNNGFLPLSEATRFGIVLGGGAAGELGVRPSLDMINIFEPGDLRLAASIGFLNDDPNAEAYVNKFVDYTAGVNGHNMNIVALRYADVLLMLAEALGEGAESYELINMVRRRGFGLDSTVPDPAVDVDGTTTGTFIEKVMDERRRELAFELHRWIDLLRLPQADVLNIMNTHLNNEPEYSGDVFNLTANNLLYPIPTSEVESSGGVVAQNPGF
ncbi:MAG: RagB/SusD family nutrient uptake outer membrane protein [Bacteroidetes bacterium]|nr:RagB/SusD family nutrient uptake outer membrane protein [Bacteroidota bacterium]MDA1119300.1 RagB/SusD family nutrient uptake outer membrane protein [Bacteroidota bacterium]